MILGDLFYPDNKPRVDRSKQPANDCLDLCARINMDAQEIAALLKDLDRDTAEAYMRIVQEPIPVPAEPVPSGSPENFAD
jgi:hypothetical protein